MNKFFYILFITFIFINTLSCTQTVSNFVVYDGKSQTKLPILVIPNKPKGIEIKAANLFNSHFKELTQKSLTILAEKNVQENSNEFYIFIGKTDYSKTLNNQEKIKWDGFAINRENQYIYITSKQDMGLLYGVNAFFEKFANIFYVDSNEKIVPQNGSIILKEKEWISNPDFLLRTNYFPTITDYQYNLWHATHSIEEKWNVWGHNLNKLVDGATVGSDLSIYALQNGKRNDAQYCFSSSKLQEALIVGIKRKQLENPDATYFSIAANDNNIICGCELCTKINEPQSATNSVVTLMKKLAQKFPDLFFTTLAYSTTKKAPNNSIQLPGNTAVLISTIDIPKGMAIENQIQKTDFERLVGDWKKTISTVFVWDYTVQYTNYFDIFPNMPALQKDLQFFKKLGIKGVFEQGSDLNYSIFGDYKSYIISKLLWNCDQDIELLKYNFFENAYPSMYDFLAEYVTQNEKNLNFNKKKLDIYGATFQSLQAYLNPQEFDLFFYEFLEKESSLESKERLKFLKLKTALIFNKLEVLRNSGFKEDGFANVNANGEIEMLPEASILLDDLSKTSAACNLLIYSEANDSVAAYINSWKKYILENRFQSVIANKPVKIISEYNNSTIANASTYFTNGTIGFLNYETNWILFNKNMEIEISIPYDSNFKNLTLSFLKDAKHFIFLPEKVTVLGKINESYEIVKEIELVNSPSFEKEIKQLKFELFLKKQFSAVKIIANNMKEIPSWNFHPTRKPTIACDEIWIN